ncbi:MAG: vWA domain-containing protein [Polyangiales bacterium]
MSGCAADGEKTAPPTRGLITAGSGGPGNGGPGSGTAANGASGIPTRPGECAQGRANASRVTPRVILVLDGSCSMSTDYPANGAESASECESNPNGRWTALRRALTDPQNGVVPKLQSIVQFGVVVYGTEGECPIPGEAVRPALNNLAAVEANLPQVQPGMFTPTGPALDWVYDNLIEQGGPDDQGGPWIVILATDGEPNSCGGGGGGRGQTNYQPSIDAVMKGTSLGVTTYVISLADAAGAFHDHLQELANLGNRSAGGSARLYEPGSPAELSAALESLIGGAVGCDISLQGSIALGQECSGSVTVNGQGVMCNGADGYVMVDPRTVRLQGKSCRDLVDNNALVEARFPCDSFVPD